eukprot:Gb_10659 [translate_table: standard]
MRNANRRLSAPISAKCLNIWRSVNCNILPKASNCFITPIGPSIWKFWRILRRRLSKHQNASALSS